MSYYQNQGAPQQQQQQGDRFFNASSVSKTLHFLREKDQQGKSRKQRLKPAFSPDVMEELSISISADKVQEFLAKIHAAMQDPQGTGGVRFSFFCKQSFSQQRQQPYDGAGITVYAVRQQQGGYGGGGNFRGGGGRRDYPPQQQYGTPYQGAPAGYGPTINQAPQAPQAPPQAPPVYQPQGYPQPPGGYGPVPPQGPPQPPANGGTYQSQGYVPPGPPTSGPTGPGPTAPTSAYPSNPQGPMPEEAPPF